MESPASIVNPDHKKKYKKGEDWISKLPDDVLIKILSHMGTLEAAKTGLLSTRWRYLWTNLDILNFDHCHECRVVHKLAYKDRVDQIVSMRKFVDRVDQIVSTHRASSIKQFRVCYDHLDGSVSSHIDEWVKFAMSKRVNCLELDLGTYCSWVFPKHTLTRDAFNISPFGSGIDFLTSLSLTSVNIDGSSIELFLSKFHGLERLCVENSRNLVSLRVGDSCKKLKYLVVRNCLTMEILELGAKNLTYFEFISCHERNKVVYNSLPSLAEASFGGPYCNALQASSFQKISTFSSQLIKLSLSISEKASFNPYNFPSFQNVKHLELTVSGFSLTNLVPFACFLGACTALLELELKVLEMLDPYMRKICWDWKLRVPPSTRQFSLYFLQSSVRFDAIDDWIKYVFARRVEKLVLHTYDSDKATPYTLQCGFFMDYPRKTRFRLLKSLYLRNVNVTGEVVEVMLFHCFLLEELRVESSDDLVRLNITESSTRLKSLAISRCRNMQSLEICASNLSFLEFSGPETANVAYNGVPSLIHVVLSGGYCHNRLLPNFNQISCFSTQLVKLSLNFVKVYWKYVEYPALPNVKHLELSATPDDHDSLLPLASLAVACPILYKLKLEIWWKCSCSKFNLNDDVNYAATPKEVANETSSYRLPNLRIFEWVDYEGIEHSEDMELALYIINNACSLLKFICHTTNTDPWFQFGSFKDVFRARATGREINYSDFLEYQICYNSNRLWKPNLEKRNKSLNASRRRAQHLATYLPSTVDVCIL